MLAITGNRSPDRAMISHSPRTHLEYPTSSNHSRQGKW